eukprot:8674719-Pyramimonas_sp.AAC.1
MHGPLARRRRAEERSRSPAHSKDRAQQAEPPTPPRPPQPPPPPPTDTRVKRGKARESSPRRRSLVY